MNPWKNRVIVTLYSVATMIGFTLLRLLFGWQRHVARQLAERESASRVARRLLSELQQTQSGGGGARNTALFFCSSAGEYEQAKPLAIRLEAEAGLLCIFAVQSASGLRYARTQQESRPVFLTPPDTLWGWRKIFQVVQPRLTIVVRHEFWPAFLHVAARGSVLCLVNTTCNRHATSSAGKLWLYRTFYDLFAQIFLVRAGDQKWFQGCRAQVQVSGDTKYDRVCERIAEKALATRDLRIARLSSAKKSGIRVVIGSAWRADVSLILAAYQRMTARERRELSLVFAPHDVSAKSVQQMAATLQAAGLPAVRWSQFANTDLGPENESPVTILVDEMGMLAEIYATGDAAFVGGGLHYQVHNVLEPASQGLAVAFGPLYRNSQEAVDLVAARLAIAIRTPEEFIAWVASLRTNKAHVGRATKSWVHGLCGAANLVSAALRPKVLGDSWRNN